MAGDEKYVVTDRDLVEIARRAQSEARESAFALTPHFRPENIVEIAKSQFPRLEAQVAMHKEMQSTKRLLIIVAAACLLGGAALVVFAPTGKEQVSYIVATLLAILPLGAIGVQEFRIRTVGITLDAGTATPKDKAPRGRKRL
jgi:hypothetical protein